MLTDRINIPLSIVSLLILVISSADIAFSSDQNEVLQITLSPVQENYKAADKLFIEFTLRNNGNVPVQVLKWNTPLEGGTEFHADLFDIVFNGSKVQYIGRKIKRGPPLLSDYVTIPPGESASATVDISKGYAVDASGIYSVRYRNEFIKILKSGQVNFCSVQQTPAVQLKIIEDRLSVQGISQESKLLFIGCQSSQVETLSNALVEAEYLAFIASNALTRAPFSKRPNAERYTAWFGRYSQNNYKEVHNIFEKLYNALIELDFSFDCTTCYEYDEVDDYYAYVSQADQHVIYLCGKFWSADPMGINSQAGTIIHEMTHFDSIGETYDHVYGQDNCKLFADVLPNLAIRNSDSYEYFAENTPHLDMPAFSWPLFLPALIKNN